jgi:magnesium chelatase accessory protein
MADWDLTGLAQRLPALPFPVTIAHGDRDAAIPIAESRRLAGAKLIVLPGLGHLAHEERPDEAARIIGEAV